MLEELEKKITSIEEDMTLKNAENVIAGIPYLKNDIAHVKAQIEAYINAQKNIMG
jgi:hypothetical protein